MSFITIFTIIIIGAIYFIINNFFVKKTIFSISNKNIEYLKINKTRTPILIINSEKNFLGGGEIYTLGLYKNLLKQGYNAQILVAKNSKISKELQKLQLPFYSYLHLKNLKDFGRLSLIYSMYKICKKDKIQIIHCNKHRETKLAKIITKILKTKIIFTCHIPHKIKSKYLNNLDGFIGVHSNIATKTKERNLSIKNIEFISPFFEEEKFINFKPTTKSKEEFFKKYFNIQINDSPILCMIANFYQNIKHKNHPLLFKAIHKLIYKKNKPIQLMLAGTGALEDYLKQLAKELKIQDYVHFLGVVHDIPELLYHSDIKTLTGTDEAFGIVLLEGAFMKKPIIVGANTNMTAVVQHNKTGLLFKSNDADDLAEKINQLIDNPNRAKELGENAYTYVKENLSNKVRMQQLELFYQKVLQN